MLKVEKRARGDLVDRLKADKEERNGNLRVEKVAKARNQSVADVLAQRNFTNAEALQAARDVR